jgi:hypothetical protein
LEIIIRNNDALMEADRGDRMQEVEDELPVERLGDKDDMYKYPTGMSSDSMSAKSTPSTAKKGGIMKKTTTKSKSKEKEEESTKNWFEKRMKKTRIINPADRANKAEKEIDVKNMVFKVIEEPADGDCLSYAICDFYRDIGALTRARDMWREGGWNIDKTYRYEDTAVAFNRLNGCNTVIIDNVSKIINKDIVDKNALTCYLLQEGNHFDYLQPDVDGDLMVPVEYNEIEHGGSLIGVPIGLAQYYAQYMTKKGEVIKLDDREPYRRSKSGLMEDEIDIRMDKMPNPTILKGVEKKGRYVGLEELKRMTFADEMKTRRRSRFSG